VIDLSEKTCDRCHQPIKPGEGYAETDIGTGKWVHWPACPPSARLVPEEHAIRTEVDGVYFYSPPLRDMFIDAKAKGLIDVLALCNRHLLTLTTIIKDEEAKFDIEDATELIGYVMKELRKQTSPSTFSSSHHSSPEHHVSREEAEAEINVLIDNLAEAIKKGGEIPDYLRQALRKNFMFFKSNPHPLVSTGNFDVKYIDSATGKTVEKTILAKEQFDLYRQQREGKINIISIHPSASSGNPDGLKREDDRILRPPF